MIKMNKGQGSLEYLLLIGGAVLVAVLVVTFLLTASESTGSTVSSTVDTFYGVTGGTIICDGQFELENPIIIANGSASNQTIAINGTKTIRHVTLRQTSPVSHFTQTYEVSVDNSPIGSIADNEANTENLTLGTSGPTVTDSFDFKVEIITSNPLEVEFASIIILCN